jgi:hypothetical protein
MEITSVTGPEGGLFGFWEAGRATGDVRPTIAFVTNAPTGNFAFQVSKTIPGTDDIDQDPFGHIHGRAWTADRPGDYFVTFQLADRSTTGPDGGSWHTPSENFVFHFKAGPDFQPVGRMEPGSGYVLTWPGQMGIWEPYQTGIVFEILRSTDPAARAWTFLGKVTGTTAATVTFTDTAPPARTAFYRIARAWAGRDAGPVE